MFQMNMARSNLDSLSSHLVPTTDDTYDIGSSTVKWKDLYLDGVAYLDKCQISPQGATVPTASSLAIQDNSISGVMVHIKSTPASSATGQMVLIEADGSNWGAGADVLWICSDDADAFPLTVGDSPTNARMRIDRSGTIYCGTNGITSLASNGNLTLLPNGSGITIVGDAGSTSHSLAANDDLFVSGKLEVDSTAYFDGALSVVSAITANANVNTYGGVTFNGGSGSALYIYRITEEVTIPVGSGLDPVVVSSSNLAPVDSIIKAVAVRITQAPGGGATTLDIGRTNGGNLDEFIDGMAVTLGTTANSIVENDGVLAAEDLWNATADTFTLTTDADVTGTAMKVRIVVWYEQVTEPTS